MPRKTLIKSQEFPYHITGRANNREAFPIAMTEMWRLFSLECQMIQVLYDIEIQAAVLMPNHYHMILTTPNPLYDLGIVMRYFMSGFTRSSHYRSGKTGRLFGSRYHWSIIRSTRYYGHVFKYLYRNPVKANLCNNVEDYVFSTLNGLTGKSHLPFPIHHPRSGLDINIPDSEERDLWIKWLNIPFTKEAEALIQKCLRKKEIIRIINRKDRRPEPLLECLL